MKFIELLQPETFEHFNLRADLVEEIHPGRAGGSLLLLTSGRSVECSQSPREVTRLIEAALALEPSKG